MTPPESLKKAQPEMAALFISDLHLQAAMPRTAQAFFDFLHNHAMKTQQLYLLGDLFEYWAGDDDIPSRFNRQVVDALRDVSDAGVAIFSIAGNRDFLIGDAFANATGITLLPDPHTVTIAGQKIILAHGDAQCIDDKAYMAFRAQVRQQPWQKKFLSMPLEERKAIIVGLRNDSREAQQSKPMDIMDVNAAAIASLFESCDASLMIHGHTHRPARHEYPGNRVRYVLPDWDCDGVPARGGWIAIAPHGAIKRFGIDGKEMP